MDEIHGQPARWWPLIAVFVLFFTVISGCKKPFPDPGEPIIAEAPAASVEPGDGADPQQDRVR